VSNDKLPIKSAMNAYSIDEFRNANKNSYKNI